MNVDITDVGIYAIKFQQLEVNYRFFMYLYAASRPQTNCVRRRSLWTGDPEDWFLPRWWTAI